MSFSERKGDLFDADDLDALAHGVNCKGVMGAGIAKEFATRYPRMKEHYRALCEQGNFYPGRCEVWHADTEVVYNLATQKRPGPDAKLRWVARSVSDMLDHAEVISEIKRIGMPRIGCGIGGLEWVEVRMIIELLSIESSVEVVVFSL